MVLGSNGLDGKEPYAYTVGTEFQNGPILSEIELRTNLVYKVQMTGLSTATVNMYNRVRGARYMLVSSDPSFPPSSTKAYVADANGTTIGAEINNGDYISFGTFLCAPGGISKDLRVWLRADDPTSLKLLNNDKVDVWGDQTALQNDYDYTTIIAPTNTGGGGYTAATRPTYFPIDDRMNFRPSVNFAVEDFLGIRGGRPMSVAAPAGYTSFVVYHNTEYSAGGRRLYTHGFGASPNPNSAGSRYPALGFSPGSTGLGVGRIYASADGGELQGAVAGFQNSTTALHMIQTKRGNGSGDPGYYVHDFGGFGSKVLDTSDLGSTEIANFGRGFNMATSGTLGGASLSGTGTGSGAFRGLISEVFFYERLLTEAEQNVIRGYLGIKYGITLDANLNSNTINYDYVLSDGSTYVWKGNSLLGQGFHHNIAGLVRDNAADLFNNRARSSADGAVLAMSIPELRDRGQGAGSLLQNDLSGLFWGHNGETGTRAFTVDVCGNMDERDKKIWLIDKTNLGATTVNIGAYNAEQPYWGPGYQVYMLVADDPSKLLDNDAWDLAIPGVFKDG